MLEPIAKIFKKKENGCEKMDICLFF